MFEVGSSFSSVIDPAALEKMAQRIKKAFPGFNSSCFLNEIDLGGLKISERSRLIASALERHLPDDFEKSATILLHSLPPKKTDDPPGKTTGSQFIVMPMAEYIARRGLSMQFFNTAMQTLKIMTSSFSSEFAVRPFLEQFPTLTLDYLKKCALDHNVDVRRLASEGSRPRLPWAKPLRNFIEDPDPLFAILEVLRDDPQLYVRRSVANSLNDISKDHPDALVKRLRHWRKDTNPERDWVIRHGLRTLVKRSHPGALALLGYKTANLEVDKFKHTKLVRIGEDLQFSFNLVNRGNASDLMIDYAIIFCKKNGMSEKVFKLKKVRLKANEQVQISTKRKLAHFSTRIMYPGLHELVIQINGQRIFQSTFQVKK